MSYHHSNLCLLLAARLCCHHGDSKGFSYLELLGEGVGGVQVHDVLHKLLHCQRLVTICSQTEETRLIGQDDDAVLTILASTCGTLSCRHQLRLLGDATCGQQQGRRRGRYHLRRRTVVRVEMSHLDAVSVTQTERKRTDAVDPERRCDCRSTSSR